jgi:hypothetical protein
MTPVQRQPNYDQHGMKGLEEWGKQGRDDTSRFVAMHHGARGKSAEFGPKSHGLGVASGLRKGKDERSISPSGPGPWLL